MADQVQAASQWLAPARTNGGTRATLFCLPHAGAGAAGYFRWRRLLSSDIEVCPVLLPGREIRLLEQPVEHWQPVVDALMLSIVGHLDKPYAIFGHSMGALLAYEWARRLQREGLPTPECLIVSGRDAAHRPFGHRDLHRLHDAAFIEALRLRYGGANNGVLDDPEMRAIFLPILRADLTLVESYYWVDGPPLHCPLRAFAGVDDLSVSNAGLSAWGELTTKSFASQRLPGDHFYNQGVGEAELLRQIEALLLA